MSSQIDSYREHVPSELKALRIWGIAIGKRPTLKWKDPATHFTFFEAIEKLQDVGWIEDRRRFIVNNPKNPRPDLADAIARLMAILSDTPYWVQDYDFRKVTDGEGNYIYDISTRKPLKKDRFDDDQEEVLNIEKRGNWGYPSSSGDGAHLWVRKGERQHLCKINDEHVNEGLSEFELKHDVIYLPPTLKPFDKSVKFIATADGVVTRRCGNVEEYRASKEQSKKPKADPKPEGTLGHDPAAATPPSLSATLNCKKHKDADRFVAQCRWLKFNDKIFIPDRKEYSGFIIRAVSMGIDRETIIKICKTQPNFDENKDPADIRSLQPKGDVEDQVAVAFSKLKKFGFDTSADLTNFYQPHVKPPAQPQQSAKPQQPAHSAFIIKDISEIADAAEPNLIHPFLPERGFHWLMSADAFSGKTTQFAWWCRQLNEMGFVNLIIAADMRESKIKRRLLEIGCKEGMTMVLDLDKYDAEGRRIRLSRDGLVALINRYLDDKGIDRDKLGCIILDPVNKIVGRIWDSIAPRGYKGKVIAFDERDRSTAEDVSGMVFKYLAETFNCVVGGIGHPSKAKEGRCRFPGTVTWEAEAEYVFRLFKQGGTDIENQPKIVLKLFKGLSNQQNFRVLEVAKARDNEELYGIYRTELIKEDDSKKIKDLSISKVDTADITDTDDYDQYPVPQTYISAVRDHLRTVPNTPMGFTDLNKAIGMPKTDYFHAVGIISVEIHKANSPLKFVTRNGKPLVMWARN